MTSAVEAPARPRTPRPIRVLDLSTLADWQRVRIMKAVRRLRPEEHASDCPVRHGASTDCVWPIAVCVPVRRYSASQIQLFCKCKRKWWFEYPGGLKSPPSKSQGEGKIIHAELETFVNTGAEPKHPRARQALFVLEDHLANAEVEGEIKIYLPDAFDGMPREITGYIDLVRYHPVRPLVIDHKTTSNPDKYARTEYELVEDAQLLVYAKWLLDLIKTAEAVDIGHTVIPTKGANRPRLVPATVTRAHVESRWATYLPILDEMDRARDKSAAEVEATGVARGECKRYEGCPHQARCATAIFAPGRKTMNANDLKARIAEIKNKPAPSTSAPAPLAAVPDPTPERVQQPAAQGDVAPALAALRERIKAQQSQAPADSQAPAPQPEPAPSPKPPTDLPPAATASAPRPARPVNTAPKPAPAPAPEPIEPAAPNEIELVEYPNRLPLLFLNCAPSHGMTAWRLEQWIAPLLDRIQRETQLAWQAHSYRQGCALVVDAINTHLVPDALIVDTRTFLGQTVLEALIPRADVIIEGNKT
jgi:CRISPR/Cas system-associated exonuclease Cas4 (RecB family)